jgi:hypothetical protein
MDLNFKKLFSVFLFAFSFLLGKPIYAQGVLVHGWNDYFAKQENWVQTENNIFFPKNAEQLQPDIYTFFIHQSFFGNVKNRIFSGIYSSGNRKNAVILGENVTIPRMNDTGGILTKIQAVGGDGDDYYSMCYIAVDNKNPLNNSVLFGDKPWPAGDYDVPCAQNVFAVLDKKDLLGAIDIGHRDQSEGPSDSFIMSNQTFSVSEGELSVTLRAPFGYGLTPKVSFVPQESSILSEIKVFSADGKWTLPVVSGIQLGSEQYENQYLNVDDDLTKIHQYKLRWTKLADGFLFTWYLNGYAYAHRIVNIEKMPQFKLKIELDAKKTNTFDYPVTKNSYLSLFDIRLSRFGENK